MAKQTKNEVALAETFQLPQIANDIKSLIEEEMDGLQLSFERIKVPSGGGLAFEVPDENGDTDVQKELLGIIVGHGPENVYYMSEFTGGSEPPDCVAVDGKLGTGSPGGDCAECPYNQWGSGTDGIGKACQNRHKVFILFDGELFPYMLTLPATSIKNFSDFVKRNVMKNRRTSSFVTRVGLMKDKSKTGIEYSKCTFEVDSFLDPAKADMAYNYAQGIKAMVGMVSTEKQAPVEVDWDAEMTEEVM